MRLNIARDWGSIADSSFSMQMTKNGLLYITEHNPNIWAEFKLKTGASHSIISHDLTNPNEFHTFINKEEGGPCRKGTHVGLTDDSKFASIYQFVYRDGYYEEFRNLAEGGFLADCEHYGNRKFICVSKFGASLIFFNLWHNNIEYCAGKNTLWIAGAITRVGKTLWVSKSEDTTILAIKANCSASNFYVMDTITSPVAVKTMCYDGKYLWVTTPQEQAKDKLYQLSIGYGS